MPKTFDEEAETEDNPVSSALYNLVNRTSHKPPLVVYKMNKHALS